MKIINGLFLAAFVLFASIAQAAGNIVEMQTNAGTIEIELYEDKAPVTVANFKQYINDGFFDGTVFHRVIPGFMIQGGGFSEDLQRKQTREPIKNEAANGLKNEVGTIAMARTSVRDSATSQFFINVADNLPLNYSGENPRGWGYAVFGKVVSGMDIVMQISTRKTQRKGQHGNVPVEPIIIEKVQLKEAANG